MAPWTRRGGRRRVEGGQVLPMIALMLPFMFLFLGFTFASELFFNSKELLDEATQTAAVAASAQSCMSSYDGVSTYAGDTTAEDFPCYVNDDINNSTYVSLGDIPDYYYASAWAVKATLQNEYPSYTVRECPFSDTSTQCVSDYLSGTSVVYQIAFYTSPDPSTAQNPVLASSGDFTGVDTGTYFQLQTACSQLAHYAMEVRVTTWIFAEQPLANFISPGQLAMKSQQTAVGCLGSAA